MIHLQDAHRQQTVDWCDATQGTAAAFDFTTKVPKPWCHVVTKSGLHCCHHSRLVAAVRPLCCADVS